MYTSFRIQNFKGFRDLTFNDLARVNLIAGKNNTGKTSVLEAIAFHSGRYWISETLRIRNMPDDDEDTFRWQEIEAGELPDWNTLFHRFDLENSVRLDGNHGKQPLRSTSKSSAALTQWTVAVQQPDDKVKELHAPYFHGRVYDFIGTDKVGSVKITITSPQLEQDSIIIFAMSNNSVTGSGLAEWENKFRNLPVFLVASEENGKETVNTDLFTKVDQAGGKPLLIKALSAIDNRLTDLKIQTEYGIPKLGAEIKGMDKASPLSTFGDGFTRLIYMIAIMAVIPGGILLIDEIENGLHYSVLPDVWRAINEASKLFNVQVFATTHSREVIAAAHEVFVQDSDDYDFRYHRLNRSPDTNDILLTTYAPDTLNASLESGYEVR